MKETMEIKNNYITSDEEQRLLEERIMRKRAERRRANRRRLRRNRTIAIITLLLITILVYRSCTNDNESKESINNNINAPKAYVSSENSTEGKTSASESDDLSELRNQIYTAVQSYNGTWSIYVKNLDTEYFITINNRQVYAASEIKLFALAAAYQQIADGVISEDEVYNTLFEMTANSSNEAFNSIVWTLGKYYISNWCVENGYNDTVQCHGLYPAYNADGLATSNGYNLTTVKDIGLLLESMYQGKCVSDEYSNKMIDMLLEQEYRSKIPAGIPNDVKIANKTGETDDVSHDSAIVYSDNADYILVVMADAPGQAWSCGDNIAELSGIVYKYFN